MKHKHAEVLIAIAEGREVERWWSDGGQWMAYADGDLANPIYYVGLEWRVKKDPVVEVIYFEQSRSSIDDKISFNEIKPDLEKWDIKITFEDDIAVKAEFPFKVKIDGLK
jgi:hypothetical protein